MENVHEYVITSTLAAEELDAALAAAHQSFLRSSVYGALSTTEQQALAGAVLSTRPNGSRFDGATALTLLITLGPPALGALKAYFEYLTATVRKDHGSNALKPSTTVPAER